MEVLDSVTGKAEPLEGVGRAARVHLASALAGEDGARDLIKVVEGWNATPINANGATVVVTGPGTFWGIVVVAAAGSVSVNAYDNTAASGQRLMQQRSAASAGEFPALANGSGGINFGTGLTINCSADPTDACILAIWK